MMFGSFMEESSSNSLDSNRWKLALKSKHLNFHFPAHPYFKVFGLYFMVDILDHTHFALMSRLNQTSKTTREINSLPQAITLNFT